MDKALHKLTELFYLNQIHFKNNFKHLITVFKPILSRILPSIRQFTNFLAINVSILFKKSERRNFANSEEQPSPHDCSMSLAQHLHELEVSTNGPGFTRLNERLNNLIARTSIERGMLHLTCLHTSASLTINENADPRVLKDLQAWMDAVVPQDGKGPINGEGSRTSYLHDDEGDDDMPAHIRTALTSQTISLSIDNGKMLLGIWQGIYLWEHRAIPHVRRIACHIIGETEVVLKPVTSDRGHQKIAQSCNESDTLATDIRTDIDINCIEFPHKIATSLRKQSRRS